MLNYFIATRHLTLTTSQLVGDNYPNSFNSPLRKMQNCFTANKKGRPKMSAALNETFITIMINPKSKVILNLGKCLFEMLYEVVGHGFGEAQGRKKTENVC